MSVVMLSGPIGAGKTTVARELVAISPAPLCYIEGDTFWSLFAKPDAKPAKRTVVGYQKDESKSSQNYGPP
jgi:adenylate kinase family enzyme